ncbi:MAG: TetR/AcrR family transcriptional regulator [Parvibaculaceae bacterium]
MGRPREFDAADVLTSAYEVFWTKGYEATTTRELTEATGLTPASIYNAYGDKRGLFIAAIEHYLDTFVRERIARLGAAASPADAITQYFRETVDRTLADPRHRGCFLVNTALEGSHDDPELQELVANETRLIEGFLRNTIKAGQAQGKISIKQSAEDLSRHLLSVLLGLRVLARVRPDAKLFDSLLRPAFASLGLSWTTRPRRTATTSQR